VHRHKSKKQRDRCNHAQIADGLTPLINYMPDPIQDGNASFVRGRRQATAEAYSDPRFVT
jgi:hypothetical protein